MPGLKAPLETRHEQILDAAFAVAVRTGIEGVTLRAVAAEASVSHGLVLFHFKQKEQLIVALLDRVLDGSGMEQPSPTTDVSARAGLSAVLQLEMERTQRDPRSMRLFVEYWALGLRDPEIGRRIGGALERYRDHFRALAAAALAEQPDAAPHVTPDTLAAVAVSLINGCVVQAMIDPKGFDAAGYLGAVQGVVDGLVPRARPRAPATRRLATR